MSHSHIEYFDATITKNVNDLFSGSKRSSRSSYGEVEYMKLLDGNARAIKMDFVYYPEINEYMGNKKVQMVINNFRVSQ